MSVAFSVVIALTLAAQSAPIAPPISSEPTAIPFDIPARALDCHLVNDAGKTVRLKFAIPAMAKGTSRNSGTRIRIESSDSHYSGIKRIMLLTMPNERTIEFEILLRDHNGQTSEGLQITFPLSGIVRATLSDSYSSMRDRRTISLGLCRSEILA